MSRPELTVQRLSQRVCSERAMMPQTCLKRHLRSVVGLCVYTVLLVGATSCDDAALDTPDTQEIEGEITPLSSGSLGLTEEELLDPKSCQPCHPTHYAEWANSVHAHASTSPIFRALNMLGQEETGGELGSFCVQCHAPVAVALGATSDGLNLDSIKPSQQGVTCAYCHQISEVNGTHNNPLTWAQDGVMRGRLTQPRRSAAHRSMYSPLLDGRQRESSDLCGACHDIVTPTEVHLERTYWEWKRSFFSDPQSTRHNSCIDCHMPSREVDSIAQGALGNSVGAQSRRHHDHLMPGVDLVISTPHREHLLSYGSSTEQAPKLREAVERELGFSLLSELCVEVGARGGADVEVYLENIGAGHRFPSGAALDRRLWVELRALDADGEVIFSSGEVAPDQPAVELELVDPQMWLLRDRALTSSGEETHFFWEIDRVERATLPSATLLSPQNPDYEEPHVLHRYRFGTERVIREIHLNVKMRAIGLEVLQDLVERQLLPQTAVTSMPTFDLRSARRVWRAEEATPRLTLSGRRLLCTSP